MSDSTKQDLLDGRQNKGVPRLPSMGSGLATETRYSRRNKRLPDVTAEQQQSFLDKQNIVGLAASRKNLESTLSKSEQSYTAHIEAQRTGLKKSEEEITAIKKDLKCGLNVWKYAKDNWFSDRADGLKERLAGTEKIRDEQKAQVERHEKLKERLSKPESDISEAKIDGLKKQLERQMQKSPEGHETAETAKQLHSLQTRRLEVIQNAHRQDRDSFKKAADAAQTHLTKADEIMAKVPEQLARNKDTFLKVVRTGVVIAAVSAVTIATFGGGAIIGGALAAGVAAAGLTGAAATVAMGVGAVAVGTAVGTGLSGIIEVASQTRQVIKEGKGFRQALKDGTRQVLHDAKLSLIMASSVVPGTLIGKAITGAGKALGVGKLAQIAGALPGAERVRKLAGLLRIGAFTSSRIGRTLVTRAGSMAAAAPTGGSIAGINSSLTQTWEANITNPRYQAMMVQAQVDLRETFHNTDNVIKWVGANSRNAAEMTRIIKDTTSGKQREELLECVSLVGHLAGRQLTAEGQQKIMADAGKLAQWIDASKTGAELKAILVTREQRDYLKTQILDSIDTAKKDLALKKTLQISLDDHMDWLQLRAVKYDKGINDPAFEAKYGERLAEFKKEKTQFETLQKKLEGQAVASKLVNDHLQDISLKRRIGFVVTDALCGTVGAAFGGSQSYSLAKLNAARAVIKDGMYHQLALNATKQAGTYVAHTAGDLTSSAGVEVGAAMLGGREASLEMLMMNAQMGIIGQLTGDISTRAGRMAKARSLGQDALISPKGEVLYDQSFGDRLKGFARGVSGIGWRTKAPQTEDTLPRTDAHPDVVQPVPGVRHDHSWARRIKDKYILRKPEKGSEQGEDSLDTRIHRGAMFGDTLVGGVTQTVKEVGDFITGPFSRWYKKYQSEADARANISAARERATERKAQIEKLEKLIRYETSQRPARELAVFNSRENLIEVGKKLDFSFPLAGQGSKLTGEQRGQWAEATKAYNDAMGSPNRNNPGGKFAIFQARENLFQLGKEFGLELRPTKKDLDALSKAAENDPGKKAQLEEWREASAQYAQSKVDQARLTNAESALKAAKRDQRIDDRRADLIASNRSKRYGDVRIFFTRLPYLGLKVAQDVMSSRGRKQDVADLPRKKDSFRDIFRSPLVDKTKQGLMLRRISREQYAIDEVIDLLDRVQGTQQPGSKGQDGQGYKQLGRYLKIKPKDTTEAGSRSEDHYTSARLLSDQGVAALRKSDAEITRSKDDVDFAKKKDGDDQAGRVTDFYALSTRARDISELLKALLGGSPKEYISDSGEQSYRFESVELGDLPRAERAKALKRLAVNARKEHARIEKELKLIKEDIEAIDQAADAVSDRARKLSESRNALADTPNPRLGEISEELTLLNRRHTELRDGILNPKGKDVEIVPGHDGTLVIARIGANVPDSHRSQVIAGVKRFNSVLLPEYQNKTSVLKTEQGKLEAADRRIEDQRKLLAGQIATSDVGYKDLAERFYFKKKQEYLYERQLKSLRNVLNPPHAKDAAVVGERALALTNRLVAEHNQMRSAAESFENGKALEHLQDLCYRRNKLAIAGQMVKSPDKMQKLSLAVADDKTVDIINRERFAPGTMSKLSEFAVWRNTKIGRFIDNLAAFPLRNANPHLQSGLTVMGAGMGIGLTSMGGLSFLTTSISVINPVGAFAVGTGMLAWSGYRLLFGFPGRVDVNTVKTHSGNIGRAVDNLTEMAGQTRDRAGGDRSKIIVLQGNTYSDKNVISKTVDYVKYLAGFGTKPTQTSAFITPRSLEKNVVTDTGKVESRTVLGGKKEVEKKVVDTIDLKELSPLDQGAGRNSDIEMPKTVVDEIAKITKQIDEIGLQRKELDKSKPDESDATAYAEWKKQDDSLEVEQETLRSEIQQKKQSVIDDLGLARESTKLRREQVAHLGAIRADRQLTEQMPKGLTPEQEVAWKQERQSQIQDKREAVARQKEIGKQGRSVEEKLHDQALVLEALQKLDKYKPGKVDVKPTLMEEPISRLKPILRARQAARMTTSEGNLSKKVVEDFEMQYGADARKSLMDALSKGWDPGEQGTLAKPYDFVQVGAEDNGALARLRTEILSKNNPTWNAPEKQVDNYSGRTFYQDQTDAYALRGTTSVYGTDRFVNLGKDAYAPVKSPGMGEANAATRSQDGRGDHMATANGLGRQAADDNKVLLLDLRNFEHPDPQKALSQSSLRMMRSALKGFEQQVLSMQRGSDDMSQGFRVAILAPENVALKDDIKLDLRNFREETAAMKKGIKPKTEGEESQVWHEFTIFPTVKLKAEPESDANSSVDLGSAHMPKTS